VVAAAPPTNPHVYHAAKRRRCCYNQSRCAQLCRYVLFVCCLIRHGSPRPSPKVSRPPISLPGPHWRHLRRRGYAVLRAIIPAFPCMLHWGKHHRSGVDALDALFAILAAAGLRPALSQLKRNIHCPKLAPWLRLIAQMRCTAPISPGCCRACRCATHASKKPLLTVVLNQTCSVRPRVASSAVGRPKVTKRPGLLVPPGMTVCCTS
jgi:hypothetical protein